MNRRSMEIWLSAALLLACSAAAQPVAEGKSVRFVYRDSTARSVSVVGDFNGWSRGEDPLRDSAGVWTASRPLWPGLFQYKFLVDGERYELDPANPATRDNYNRSAKNSAFVVTDDYQILLSAVKPSFPVNPDDRYPAPPGQRPVILNIIWHQHQPLYVNPETDQLTGPWVRTHATKDYYDMAALLRRYPDVHCTVNLTSSLLVQLQEYYVARLRPFVDVRQGSIQAREFLARWRGKTDPWIDLALTPSELFGSRERDLLYRNSWSCFSISDVMIGRFPEYQALRAKIPRGGAAGDDLYTVQELREIKFWFYLSMFDPDFLAGPVTLEDGSICDLSDLVRRAPDGTYRLKRRVTEADCRRMVVESYKVMASVVPVHRKLRYDPGRHRGQIDVITTPYYHPILPLLYDSDIARTCQPGDSLPRRFSYPEDADAQVAKAVKFYTKTFGTPPEGMWPGEGSVAQEVLPVLRRHGILWTASDVKVLLRSRPVQQPNSTAYQFPAGEQPISLVFRNTELSDRIGFKYQEYTGEEAAEDFVQAVLAMDPAGDKEDVLVTVILDGENAWEWYRKDNDGKEFLHALYRKLTRLTSEGRVVTTTMSEYLRGNPARGIAPHPVEGKRRMEWLWPGSWINGNFDTWIGEAEENRAWEYLLTAREDLAASGVPRPNPASDPPRKGKALYAYRAWESMYAAEGSDWFWWYGSDQSAPGGDRPFDTAFLTHIRNVYSFALKAGGTLPVREFSSILLPAASGSGGGTMARGSVEERTVVFECDARAESVKTSIYIAGSVEALGSWKPNVIALRDDGRRGDRVAGDGIWTLSIALPLGQEIQYKYTNSGEVGVWVPGEEFSRNRSLVVAEGTGPLIVRNIFGK
jgi:alpha-amylase/alpha-mannosidase (GH57 family)